jgi:hypothetical protein
MKYSALDFPNDGMISYKHKLGFGFIDVACMKYGEYLKVLVETQVVKRLKFRT